MNTLSSFYKIIPLAVVTLLMVSCEGFLDEDPKGRLAPQYFFEARADFDAAVHALYAQTVALGASEERVAAYVAGDDVTVNARAMEWQAPYDVFYGVDDNNDGLHQQWEYLFTVVKAANFIINNAKLSSSITQEILDNYLAQAYYWRAFAYYHLVTIWGPLPLIISDGVDYEAVLHPVDEIWTEVILPDIEKAELAPIRWSSVPGAAPQSTVGNNVWVTQQAAKASAAYLYLAYAGWPTNKTEYYARAAQKAKEVIDGVDNGTYPNGLMDEFWQNYSVTYKEDCKEALLSRYFRLTSLNNWSSYDVLPGDVVRINLETGVVSGGGGWQEFLGEIKFWNAFPEGPRKEQTYAPKTLIRDPDPDNNDAAILVDWWDERREDNIRTPWFIKTIAQRPVANGGYDGEYDYTLGATGLNGFSEKAQPLVRLSEVYCWYAEAVGRSGQGDKNKAVELLNKVRNRADQALSNVYDASMSNEALAEAALAEHGWEVAGDFYCIFAPRYFDMFRMNRMREHFEYRQSNPGIEVAPGVIRKEVKAVPPGASWNDRNIYAPYYGADAIINPNLVRP